MKISNRWTHCGVKTAFVVLLGFLLLGAISPQFAVRYEPARFRDCNAAAAYVVTHPTVGRYDYQITARFEHATVTHTPALAPGYSGNAQIHFALTPRSTVMVLPRWSWPNMTRAQREVLAEFLDALRNHELGHAEIAQRGIAGRESNITVVASSQALAKTQLAAELARELHSLYAEVLQTQRAYDHLTDNGRHQSDGPQYGFRGGEEVTFGCR